VSGKYWIGAGAGAIALAIVVFIGFKVSDALTYVNIATGYTAQQTCACLHVSGRSLESCKSDYPADAVSHINFETTGDHVRVSAAGGMFKAQADFDATFGCRIVAPH
jgi:hypothetical protein